jgi:hypothetical protein
MARSPGSSDESKSVTRNSSQDISVVGDCRVGKEDMTLRLLRLLSDDQQLIRVARHEEKTFERSHAR